MCDNFTGIPLKLQQSARVLSSEIPYRSHCVYRDRCQGEVENFCVELYSMRKKKTKKHQSAREIKPGFTC